MRYPNIPGYQILCELGRGGMGVVYLARQVGRGPLVALKMIRGGACAGAVELARFQREFEAAAGLRHPNVVPVYEYAEADGLPYFTMEFLAGGGLDKRLGGVAQPVDEACRLTEVLARAMHHAHLHGFIHRDLKPPNILLAAAGTPKIGDFGLAKLLSDDQRLTPPGEVFGTPPYMAPEQIKGDIEQIGPPADVYALGAILYELLTGRPPFKGASHLQTMQLVVAEAALPPSRRRPGLCADLDSLCLRCLHKNPAARPSAESLAGDLGRLRSLAA
jgi:serine/threonine-protein kinase